MHIIVCVDDRFGMRFGGRRQSRDRLVTEDILRRLEGRTLRIAPCSQALFGEGDAVVSERLLEDAAEDDVCFVEDRSPAPFAKSIRSCTLYRWNRHYPADLHFDLDLAATGFRFSEAEDFAGFSHEKITREVYVK